MKTLQKFRESLTIPVLLVDIVHTFAAEKVEYGAPSNSNSLLSLLKES